MKCLRKPGPPEPTSVHVLLAHLAFSPSAYRFPARRPMQRTPRISAYCLYYSLSISSCASQRPLAPSILRSWRIQASLTCSRHHRTNTSPSSGILSLRTMSTSPLPPTSQRQKKEYTPIPNPWLNDGGEKAVTLATSFILCQVEARRANADAKNGSKEVEPLFVGFQGPQGSGRSALGTRKTVRCVQPSSAAICMTARQAPC